MGLDFSTLPYYFDGDLKITQSLAIIRYLARKFGLFATDEKSLTRQDLVEQQISFVWDLLLKKDKYEKNKVIFLEETLPKQLELLSKFLGDNEWLIEKLNYVHFLAYEVLDWMRQYSPENVQKFDNLMLYFRRFECIPEICAYINSNEYKSWPIFSKILNWGIT